MALYSKKTLSALPAIVIAAALALTVLFPGAAYAAYSWNDSRGPGNGDAPSIVYDAARGITYRGTTNRGVWKYQGGTWVSMGGGVSALNVSALAFDGAVLYAGTGSGVWRCKNPDTSPSWAKMSAAANIGNYSILSLAYDGTANALYAGPIELFSGKGAWRCANPAASSSWTSVSTAGDVGDYAVSSMHVDGANNTLYAGTSLYGLWRCSGASSSPSWTKISGSGDVGDLVINSLGRDSTRNILYAGASDAFTGQGVWRCTDPGGAGWSWTKISGPADVGGLTVHSLASDRARNILYAGTDRNGAWRCTSPASGTPSWTKVSGTGDVGASTVSSLSFNASANVLRAGTNGYGVWVCSQPDTAPSWSSTGGFSTFSVNSLVSDTGRNLLYAGTGGHGVWRCSGPASAPKWQKICAAGDVGNLAVTAMTYDSARNVLYAGTGGSGIWRCTTPDSSPLWAQISGPGNVGSSVITAMAYDSSRNLLYAGATDTFGTPQGLWRCKNPNTSYSWQVISGGGNIGNYIIKALACDGSRDTVYAGVYEPLATGKGVWRCSGAYVSPSWSKISGSANVGDYIIYSLAFDGTNNRLYAGTAGYGVWRCGTPGSSPAWVATGGGVSGFSISALSYDRTRDVLYAATSGSGIWRCDTPGAAKPSWIDTLGDLATQNILSIATDGNRGAAYAGTTGMGAWYAAYPAISSCAPASAHRGETLNVDIVGTSTGFISGESEASFGEGIKVNSLTVTSDTRARANITISPDATLGGRDVSVVTGAEQPSVLERGFAVTSPGTFYTWYLAEGTSDWGFDTYVTIENPNSTAVTAEVTYMTKDGPRARPDITLPAMSQTVINPRNDLGSTDFSTKVVCKEKKTIAVDRRMVWTGPGAASPEAHSSIGVTAPARTWYLPEGSSDWGFECWILVQNPGSSPAEMKFTYMIEGEGPKQVTRQVPAGTRGSFNMADDIGAEDASVKISSPVPVIAERAMYRDSRRSGHASIGTTSPAYNYYLAEGTTGWGFTTYVLIQNPNSETASVTVTYMTPEGPVPQAPFTMPGNSRKTIRVNDVLPGRDFSTLVQGSKALIAERAMYWETATGEACHDSIGMSSPHKTFYLPDGETSGGTETWTLVQNPNDVEVTVELSYLTPDGKGNKSLADRIPANSRKTYFMADVIPQGRASIMVTSKTAGKKIMAERAMYWNARGAGTNTIGGFTD